MLIGGLIYNPAFDEAKAIGDVGLEPRPENCYGTLISRSSGFPCRHIPRFRAGGPFFIPNWTA